MEMEPQRKIFEKDFYMQVFTIATIHNQEELKIVGLLDSCIDYEDVDLLINLLASDAEFGRDGIRTSYQTLRSLFWLSSIVADRYVQNCVDLIDKIDPAIRLNLRDITAVFVNWGATLDALGVVDMLPGSEFNYSPLPYEEANVKVDEGVLNKGCFSPRSLAAVLAIISQRIPIESENWEAHSKILLKVLASASLDSKLSASRTYFGNAIKAILESYSDWTIEKAQGLVAILDAGPYNIHYFVCCLLVGHNTRMQQLSQCVAIKYIQGIAWDLPTPLPVNFSQSAMLLDTAGNMINKNPYENLIVMIDLFMNLLEDYVYECKKDPTEEEEEEELRAAPIKALHAWSQDARMILKQGRHKNIILANKLYCQANRLFSYTNNLIRVTASSSFPYTFKNMQ